jgi:hypothetical protein
MVQFAVGFNVDANQRRRAREFFAQRRWQAERQAADEMAHV